MDTLVCPSCGGAGDSGNLDGKSCSICRGSGQVPTAERLFLKAIAYGKAYSANPRTLRKVVAEQYPNVDFGVIEQRIAAMYEKEYKNEKPV
jgi:hypothetical protein